MSSNVIKRQSVFCSIEINLTHLQSLLKLAVKFARVNEKDIQIKKKTDNGTGKKKKRHPNINCKHNI